MKAFYRPEEAAKLTGIPAQKIRVNMASGKWDLGSYTKVTGSSKANYIITPYKMYKQLGICIDGYVPVEEYGKQSVIQTTDELLAVLKEIKDVMYIIKTVIKGD